MNSGFFHNHINIMIFLVIETSRDILKNSLHVLYDGILKSIARRQVQVLYYSWCAPLPSLE